MSEIRKNFCFPTDLLSRVQYDFATYQNQIYYTYMTLKIKANVMSHCLDENLLWTKKML